MGLRDLNLDKKYVISMEHFLVRYYGIYDLRELFLLSGLTHSFLKSDTNIKTKCISFDEIDKDEIYIGNVILVKDVAGNIAPYKNPLRYQMDTIKLTNEKPAEKKEEEKNVESLIDLTELSYSKLLELKNKHVGDDLYSAIMHEIYNRLGGNAINSHSKSREAKIKQKSKQKGRKILTYMYAKSFK